MMGRLSYRRPSRVSSSHGSESGSEGSLKTGNSGMSHGIPEALSFDRIISGGTCPPCTTRDFLNYLKYIERSAENLQFFLWFRDYSKRFEKLPLSEQALSPEWTSAQAETAAAATAHQPTIYKPSDPDVARIVSQSFQGTDFASGSPGASITEKPDPFQEPSRTPSTEDKRDFSVYGSSFGDDKTLAGSTLYVKKAEEAFDTAGTKWQPFTAQPFRQEVVRIITVYIANEGPRQLNLSEKNRTNLLRALQQTTHPSAFREVVAVIEQSLRYQAHPNFIRWTICNGNRPRVIFARGLGIFGILAGFLADLLITLSHAGRGWRVLPFVGWFVGISTLVAAWKGMCVVLHGMHHRHLRPWELFADDGDAAHEKQAGDMSQESLRSSASNSYEDEPWVAKYKKRFVIRKIFDREIWIEEPALRQIQDTIFLQSLLAAFIGSCIFVGIFCAVPHGNLY